jgi:hypothetical protein
MEKQILTDRENGQQILNRPLISGRFAREVSQFTTEQLEQMRPTLLIFLGGSGQLMAVYLKAMLKQRFGDAWQKKIRLLVFDTAEEPLVVSAGETIVRL